MFPNVLSIAFRQCLAICCWLLCAAVIPSAVEGVALAHHDSVSSVSNAAVPQIPQPAAVGGIGARNAQLASLPTIHLGPDTTSLDIDTLSEYWIDETGKATIDQVEAQASGTRLFQPRGQAQSHAMHGNALWIRFEAHATDTRPRWFVELGVPSIQDVRLYWRDASNQWVVLRSGDATPRSQWPVTGRTPVFQLNHLDKQANVYYLRIENDRTRFSAPVHIYRDTALLEQRELEYIFIGAYTGLTALIGLISLGLALAMRDRSFSTYALYLLALGAYQMNFSGISGQYLRPNATTWAYASNFVLPPLAAAAALWFVRTVLRPKQFSALLDNLVTLLIAGLLVSSAYGGLVTSHLSYHIINALCLASVLTTYVVIGTLWARSSSGVRWIALGFLPVVLGALPAMLRNLGLINSGFLTQYGITLGAFIEMPLLLFALVLRSANRQVAMARAAGLPRQDALTGLSNTHFLLQQMQTVGLRAQRFRQTYGLFLVDLTNHDWLIKEHGQELGDRALVLLGTQLQKVARDVDLAARLEGNQFALLVEGPCNSALAAKITAKIVAGSQQYSPILPVGSRLKVRVTAALMPDQTLENSDDASTQLAWLMERAEQLQQGPPKLVYTVNF